MPFAALAAAVAAQSLPFEVHGRHIYLRATVGGETAWLVLDTGSSVTSLDAAWAARVGVRPLDQDVKALTGGTGKLPIKLAKVREIALEGGVVLQDQLVALLPFDAIRSASGRDVRGTLGYDFFARFVVEIDRPAHQLILHDPADWRYQGQGLVIPVSLDLRVPILRANLVPRGGTPVAARLILDIGTAGLPFILGTAFAKAHEWPGPGLEAPIGFGMGGPSLGRIVRLDRAEISGLTLREPLAGLGRETAGFLGSGIADGTVGAPVFERGRLFVDYPHKQVIFEPGPEFGAPYAVDDRAGLSPVRRDAGVAVGYVVAGGPAAQAGVREGDQLVAVDGRPAAGFAIDDLRATLSAPGRRRLSLRRVGKPIDVVLTPRDLSP